MAGDFAERLAAVDDAIADASEDETGGECGVDGGGAGTGVDGASGGRGVGGALREDGAGTAASESAPSGSTAGESMGSDSVTGESVDVDVVALADRVAELEAAVQALRGYAGSVRAVNDRVEERADAAVATAEDCRERVAALERRVGGVDDGAPNSRATGGERAGAAGRDATACRGRRSSDDGVGGRAVAERGVTRDADGERETAGGGGVPWPPAEPRAPYGEVDADDDREQPGLLARLRDAL